MPRVKFIVPFPLDEAGVKNRQAQLPKELIRPTFDVKFVPVKNSCAWGDSYHDLLIMDVAIFEEGLSAEAEGYDAVCIDTVSDSGMNALRSRLRIPVVAPGTVAIHFAGILGHKFSILTMWDRWIPIYKKLLDEHRLWHKCASIRPINEQPDVVNLFAGKEEKIFRRLEEEGMKAVEEDGADVIVLGSTTMHQAHRHLTEKLPVPVINPGLLAYKVVELLLEVGLSHSKKAYPPPTTPKDEMIFGMMGAVSMRK